jgi:cytochrome c biogenesis protein CcmG, thiol:disulfide interchange protein DsbE
MKWSRVIVLLAALLLVLAAALYRTDIRRQLFPLGVGSQAPNFHAQTLDSIPREKSLADYRGRVVLVNVWATWCVPCRAEMPSIQKLYDTFHPQGLEVLAVSVDEPGNERGVRDFARELGLTFTVLYDPQNRITGSYDLKGYPTTIVVGRDGTIRKEQMAASDWSSPDNRELIKQLLAEKTD